MRDNAKAMVLGSFIADSLALGAHWIYDTDEIDATLGTVDTLRAPGKNSYHTTKERGDFTHYGDQTLVLLETLATNGSFDLDEFSSRWLRFSTFTSGYRDSATKKTLENLEHGYSPLKSGSGSTDLGGPARISPLLFCYRDDLPQLRSAVKAQTAMTHNSQAALAGADFIARVVYNVFNGLSPVAAMRAALDEGIDDIDLSMRVAESLESGSQDTRQVIKKYGQACAISAGLPGAVHLVVRYEDDFKQALIANVMAGGDSAARGMTAGMILGAWLGASALPASWLNSLKAADRIELLLDKLP